VTSHALTLPRDNQRVVAAFGHFDAFLRKDLLSTEVANEGGELPVEHIIVSFRTSSLNDTARLVQPAPSSVKSLALLTLNARDSATATAGHVCSTISGYAYNFLSLGWVQHTEQAVKQIKDILTRRSLEHRQSQNMKIDDCVIPKEPHANVHVRR
jgi:hypothetical protein